jgi:hypothetical protein
LPDLLAADLVSHEVADPVAFFAPYGRDLGGLRFDQEGTNAR